MAGTVLPVSTTPGGVSGSLGAIEDLGVSQNGSRTVSIVSPSGSQGDVVEILGGNDPTMDDAFFVGTLSTTNALAGGSVDGGQNSALSSPLVFRYARTVRLEGTAALVCEVGSAAPAGGSIANAILNGGQTGPLTVGTTNASSMTLIANNIVEAVLNGSGSSTWGSASGAAATTVQGGSGGVIVDSAGGPVALAPTTATGYSLGVTGGAMAGTIAFGTGGLGIGGAAPGSSGIAIQSGGVLQALSATTSVATWNSGTTGDVNVGTGPTGADTNAKTVRVGTGAGAKTVHIGSTNTTSASDVLCGSGGLGLGTAAPGSSGVNIDTPAAGLVAIGALIATGVTLGGIASAVATGSFNVAAAGTLTLGGGAATANTVNVATGTGGKVLHLADAAAANTVTMGSTNTTSTTTVSCGSGGLGLGGASAPGSSGVSLDTPAAGAIIVGGVNATSTQIGVAATGNVAFGAPGSFGSGFGSLFIANGGTAPSGTPSGGGLLYVQAGALKYKGSSGTITTLGAA